MMLQKAITWTIMSRIINCPCLANAILVSYELHILKCIHFDAVFLPKRFVTFKNVPQTLAISVI